MGHSFKKSNHPSLRLVPCSRATFLSRCTKEELAANVKIKKLSVILVFSILTILGLSDRSFATSEFSTFYDLGIKPQFMPWGKADLKSLGEDQTVELTPSLSGGIYIDRSIINHLTVGLAGDFISNVFRQHTPPFASDLRAKMINVGLRIKAYQQLSERFSLYALIQPGYSWIIKDSLNNPSGFVLSSGLGITFSFNKHHHVFLEIDYMAGFQTTTIHGIDQNLAPSYLVTSLGYELRFFP